MKRLLTLAACLLCLSPVIARAQQTTGTYTTYAGGRALVVDHYTITRAPDGTLKTEANVGAPGSTLQQTAVTIATAHRPVSFAVSVGANKPLTADFNGATVKLHIAGQPDRELPTQATMVLENLLWHQFVFLLDQYDETKGGAQNFVAFLPSQALDYTITIERTGTPDYQAQGQTLHTRRYHLVANQTLALELWTDETRAPVLFYSAAQQLKVVRAGAENFADAALAEAPKAAEYHPPAYAQPAAFHDLQGERDYNMTMDAFHDWQRTLAARKNVTFKSYPKLDHLFLEGTGNASGADYAQPRNVASYVVDDIATWIKKQF